MSRKNGILRREGKEVLEREFLNGPRPGERDHHLRGRGAKVNPETPNKTNVSVKWKNSSPSDQDVREEADKHRYFPWGKK